MNTRMTSKNWFYLIAGAAFTLFSFIMFIKVTSGLFSMGFEKLHFSLRLFYGVIGLYLFSVFLAVVEYKLTGITDFDSVKVIGLVIFFGLVIPPLLIAFTS